jgi:hypothetical protein
MSAPAHLLSLRWQANWSLFLDYLMQGYHERHMDKTGILGRMELLREIPGTSRMQPVRARDFVYRIGCIRSAVCREVLLCVSFGLQMDDNSVAWVRQCFLTSLEGGSLIDSCRFSCRFLVDLSHFMTWPVIMLPG